MCKILRSDRQISNSVFQSVIVQLRDVSDRVFGVIDTEGCVISCTDMSMLGERWTDAALKVGNASESIVTFAQKSFKAIMGNSNYFEYAVFCSGDDETAKSFCQMAFIALNDAKTFYEEKHDRGTFVKNIIMDNILPGDIYIRAKELHFATDAPRAVFLIRQVGHSDVATVDVLTGMFPDKMQDFVLSINETDVAVIKQISGTVAIPAAILPGVELQPSVAVNCPSLQYQWCVNGVVVSTAPRLTVTDDMAGKTVVLKVVPESDSGYTGAVESNVCTVVGRPATTTDL